MKNNSRRMTFWLSCLIIAKGCTLLTAGEIDPQRGIPDPDGKITWYDGSLLTLAGKAWTNTESYYERLPAKAKAVVPKDVWDFSRDTAGMFLRFSTDASSLDVRWALVKNDMGFPHMPATGVSGIDLYIKNAQGKWVFDAIGRPRNISKNKAHFSLIPGAQYLLYLPIYNGLKSMDFGIPKDKHLSTPDPIDLKAHKPIVFYGTSITQGGCASRPGMSATTLVGRRLDIPIINLGFSGSGRMEPELANLLAELDPAIYVVDCLGNMTTRWVTERAEPFVKILRQAHPDTPILLVEDSSFKHITPTEKGIILRTIHEKLVKAGDKNLHFLSNEGMLGNDFDGTVDGIHPNDLGMARQAEVFIKALAPLLHLPEGGTNPQ
jgi:hypothetical protein